MADTREAVLARLAEVVAGIPNMRWVERNNAEFPESPRPAAIVFDSDEETDDATDATMRPAHRPTLVQMMPEIAIIQNPGEAGSDIATLRRELIRRVLTDTALNEQIVKTGRFGNGAIRYLGCRTDYGWMRSQHGGMLAQFMFKYALKPDEL